MSQKISIVNTCYYFLILYSSKKSGYKKY